LEQVVTGLASPVDLQEAPDDSGRLFVVEQQGTIRIIQDGALVSIPFLDITNRVSFSGEMGLLGLAFHPDFAQNRRLIVNYTSAVGGHTIIAAYLASAADPNLAEPGEEIILTVNQPFGNHNGGQLAFGPDGYLYIASGDGGGGGDPNGNGQSLSTLLGKLLRIDVDSATPYAVPPDNPFVGQAGEDEIWAYGLRNPWRFSFDRSTDRLFLGDVGHDDFEEVDLITRGGNFGWSIMEGNHCYPPPSDTCDMTGLILPIAEYSHDEGRSITGGFVYRGPLIAQLRGTYVFGDFISGNIWGLDEEGSGVWTHSLLLATSLSISSFGQDGAGELYVLDYGGTVFRLRAAP
jgi:glucose/arabinose dehydrogenase